MILKTLWDGDGALGNRNSHRTQCLPLQVASKTKRTVAKYFCQDFCLLETVLISKAVNLGNSKSAVVIHEIANHEIQLQTKWTTDNRKTLPFEMPIKMSTAAKKVFLFIFLMIYFSTTQKFENWLNLRFKLWPGELGTLTGARKMFAGGKTTQYRKITKANIKQKECEKTVQNFTKCCGRRLRKAFFSSSLFDLQCRKSHGFLPFCTGHL